MKVFRKMDEMNRYITLKGLKIAYAYTVVFLFIWSIGDYIINGKFKSMAFFLLITQNLILLFSQLYFKKKINDNEEK